LASVPENKIIFEQDSYGYYFYIIKSGKVDLLVDKKYVKILSKGDCFGDIALLYDDKRSGTIIAKEDTKLWCLERMKFRAVLYFINEKNQEFITKLIESNSILSIDILIQIVWMLNRNHYYFHI
jgi:CRP-like cAMP-binding protein